MPRNVRCGLIQARCEWSPEKYSLADIKKKMIAKHEDLIADAAKKKVQVLGLQELFYGPYFCAEQNIRWYDLTERIHDGPTTVLIQKLAKKHKMVIVVPVYEVDMTGVYYNTASVIDADGRYLGKYRKHHIPHCHPGFWEKFYFTPGNAGYPVFETRFARVGVYICYDRHFPEGARCLGLNEQKSFSILRRPLRGLANIFGSSSSPRTPSRINISSRRSIAWAPNIRGKSANSTGKVIFAIRAEKSSRRRAVIKTNSSSPI